MRGDPETTMREGAVLTLARGLCGPGRLITEEIMVVFPCLSEGLYFIF